VDAVEAAQQQFTAANTACKPFDTIVDTASELVKQAQDSRRNAQRDLDDAGRFGRRQARTQLADTEARLAEAGRNLEAAEDHARPTRETRAAARANLAAARRDYDSHNQIARWSYLPERLEAAEQQIDALDGWRDWAQGKNVTDGKVIDVVHSLSAEARTNDSPAHATLANVIHRWAQTKGLDLSRPAPAIERVSIEVEL
jgi:chromosome segregation ATPase